MKNINEFIEQTNLQPLITDRDVDQLVSEALQHSFIGICVPPFWVKRAKREIGSANMRLVTVIGFPFGYEMTETKIEAIRMALKEGADELDVVMNISAFKANMPWTKIEVAKCAGLIHEAGKMLKLIIETAYLDEKEIINACKIGCDAGADFIKTSTGFASSGAKEEHIRLIKKILPAHVGVKASGGIRTYEQARAMVEAGADRIGTSSGHEIVKKTL